MKILFVSSSKYTHEGSSKALIHIINQLSKEGVDVKVVLPVKQSLYQYFEEQGINCIVPSKYY